MPYRFKSSQLAVMVTQSPKWSRQRVNAEQSICGEETRCGGVFPSPVGLIWFSACSFVPSPATICTNTESWILTAIRHYYITRSKMNRDCAWSIYVLQMNSTQPQWLLIVWALHRVRCNSNKHRHQHLITKQTITLYVTANVRRKCSIMACWSLGLVPFIPLLKHDWLSLEA